MDAGPLYIIGLTLALFFGGTPALTGAVYLAVSGSVSFPLLFVLSLIVTAAWNAVWYIIGVQAISAERIRGWRLYKRNAVLYDRVLALYDRHQYRLLFLSRFAYGTNIACSVISGAKRMPLSRYFAINAVSLGVLFGTLAALSSLVHRNLATVEFPFSLATALALVVAIVFAVQWGVRKYLDRYLSHENSTDFSDNPGGQ
jgi:membrane protein DedA with SNARE-associated domain